MEVLFLLQLPRRFQRFWYAYNPRLVRSSKPYSKECLSDIPWCPEVRVLRGFQHVVQKCDLFLSKPSNFLLNRHWPTDFKPSSSNQASWSGSAAWRRRERKTPSARPPLVINLYVDLLELARTRHPFYVEYKPFQERWHNLKSSHAGNGVVIVLRHRPGELLFTSCGAVSIE